MDSKIVITCSEEDKKMLHKIIRLGLCTHFTYSAIYETDDNIDFLISRIKYITEANFKERKGESIVNK